ncbi:MAG: hypothetical protein ISQ07_06355, partial [Pirellulales bacterium]|nr:hypothetical protein [Pirellulales bacterium]
GNTWQTVTLLVPIDQPAGIVRLHLPAAEGSPVDLQLIRFSNGDTVREWPAPTAGR